MGAQIPQPTEILTSRSLFITIVHVFHVTLSQPTADLIGLSPGRPRVSVTVSVTVCPSSKVICGQVVGVAFSVQENPFGPVTNPAKGPDSCSPSSNVSLRTCCGLGGAAAIATVTACPAIVAVHVCAPPVLAAAVSVTVPVPLPDSGDTFSAALPLDAVHVDGEQPAGAAVTVTVCDPPAEENATFDGETPNAHAIVTAIVCLAESPK